MSVSTKLMFTACVFILAGCGDHSETHKQNHFAADYAEHMRMDGLVAEKAKKVFEPISSAPVENPDNLITPEKVKLGKLLYFDKRLSKDENISCNSCHNLASAGVDNLPTSPGDNGVFGNRNSPTVLNAAHHFSQFWDGRNKDVEEQAGGPILNPVEMAIPSKEFLVERLRSVEIYNEMFSAAYPDVNSPITYLNVQKAIAAFERTLVTPSRFDDYLNGNSQALTIDEKEGLKTFMDIGCITCHNGPMLGANSFQKFGQFKEYWYYTGSDHIDNGRFNVTGNEEDRFVFKVPSLRNVHETGPYFHDGSVDDLGEAINIMAEINLRKRLSEQEVKNVLTFLGSLSADIPEDAKIAPQELSSL